MTIPAPEPGLVVQFNDLWSAEFDRGREEARYPRPCAVVLAYRRTADGVTVVLLAPITHSEPRADDRAVEIPQAVKRHLGLDDLRSWVMIDEVNETAWPGFDLERTPTGDDAYGFLPPALFAKIRRGIVDVLTERRLKRVSR